MALTGEQSLRELRAVAGQGASHDELGAAISQAVAPVLAHDALRLVVSNPASGFGMSSFSFWCGYEPGFAMAMLRNCFAGNDPCQGEDLARLAVPARVVGVDPGEMRTLFSTYGVGSELRLILRDARGTWGLLGLLREQGAKPFNDDDVHRADRLAPGLIAGLRGYVTAHPLPQAEPALPPGVLILGPDDTIRSATPQAYQWRDYLWSHTQGPEWIDEMFFAAMATYARRHARDPERHSPAQFCGPAASYGQWITCHGQPLDGDGTGDIAVIIQAATGRHLLPSFCDWYSITRREREIIEHLHKGAAPKQIARTLDLSVHTVNDHLKAIFRKTGVNGRDELITAITG